MVDVLAPMQDDTWFTTFVGLGYENDGISNTNPIHIFSHFAEVSGA
jgi:hypothetical protein